MADNKVSVELDLETQAALKNLAKTEQAINKFAANSQKSLEKTEGSFGSLGTTIAGVFGGGVALKAFDAVLGAIGKIPGAIAGITESGIEAEESTKKLALALAQAGDNSQGTLKEFEDLATSLSQLIGVEDEAVAGALRLSLQFGATKEQAKQIAIAAADVAASGLIPFDDAVAQLSGSLNGVLPRAFSKSIAGIKGLSEESLKSGEAIKIVADRFRDFAAINSNNLSVQIANVGINFRELEETLGKIIARNPAVKALFITINESLKSIGEELKNNGPAIDAFITSFVFGGLRIVQVFADIFDGAARTGAVIKETFNGVAEVVNVAIGVFLDLGNALDDIVRRVETLDFTGIFKKSEEALTGFKVAGDNLTDALDFSKPFLASTVATQNFTNEFLKNYEAQKLAINDKTNAFSEGEAVSQGIAEAELARQQQLVFDIAAIKDQQATDDLNRQLLVNEGFFTSDLTLAENRQQIVLREIQDRFEAEQRKTTLIKDGNEQRLALLKATAERERAVSAATTKFDQDQKKIQQKNTEDSLSIISGLMASSSKELFAIGKAANLANAIINGISAVQNALNTPFPLNIILPPLVAASAAVNVAKIASAKPPAFAEGGVVPGNSFSGDKVTARLNSGEMVLNDRQQSNLFNLANNGGSGNIEAAISRLGDRIERMQIVVQANAREIARVVRDEREAGFA
jgi:hypothetical protein